MTFVRISGFRCGGARPASFIVLLAVFFLAGFGALPGVRAASPALDNLISRLPNPKGWQKSPLEKSLANPDAEDPTVRAFLKNMRRQDVAGALREIRTLREQYPRSASVQYTHGLLAMATRQYTEAEGAFRRVVALKPDAGAGWFMLGTAVEVQGRPVDAIAPLRRATVKLPRNPLALTQLGSCQLRAGKAADGAGSCRRALQVKGDFAPAWDVLGLCLRQQGKRAEAVKAFERAAQAAPANAVPWAHLAETLRASGRNTEAAAASARAEQLAASAAKSRRSS